MGLDEARQLHVASLHSLLSFPLSYPLTSHPKAHLRGQTPLLCLKWDHQREERKKEISSCA